jgi:hypothetical protein
MNASTRRPRSYLRPAALLPAIVALGAPAAAAADDFTVNDDNSGNGPAGATCPTPDFTNPNALQTAINDAGVADGDTLLVCSGTYNDGSTGPAANVTKELILRGAQAGIDARTRSVPAANESVVNDTNGGINIAGGVDDVTVDGFTVQGVAGDAGIKTPGDAGDQRIVNNKVTLNTFGLFLNNQAGLQSVVRHNLFDNNNVAGSAAGNGIYGDAGTDDVLVDANRFNDHENAGLLLTSTGSVTNDDVFITRNQFVNDNGNDLLNENRILLLNSTGVLIEGNTLTNNANNAIQFFGNVNGAEVSGNTVEDAGFAAVRIRDCPPSDCGVDIGANSNIGVLGNTLTGGDAAINVADGGYAGELNAHFNRIAGNATGIVLDDAGESIDAENNWWGCNEGPDEPGCNGITGTAPASVDADPWLILSIRSSKGKVRARRTASVTADLLTNSDGEVPGDNLFPDGTPIDFATNKGSVDPDSAPTDNAEATTTYRAPRKGTATVSAQLDNETVTTTIKTKRRR